MTTPTEPQTTLRLNYKDRNYEFSELPRTAQILLQDMVRIEQQVNQLQFELRHLQAARQVYNSSLLQSMSEEENAEGSSGSDENGSHENGSDQNDSNSEGDHHD